MDKVKHLIERWHVFWVVIPIFVIFTGLYIREGMYTNAAAFGIITLLMIGFAEVDYRLRMKMKEAEERIEESMKKIEENLKSIEDNLRGRQP